MVVLFHWWGKYLTSVWREARNNWLKWATKYIIIDNDDVSPLTGTKNVIFLLSSSNILATCCHRPVVWLGLLLFYMLDCLDLTAVGSRLHNSLMWNACLQWGCHLAQEWITWSMVCKTACHILFGPASQQLLEHSVTFNTFSFDCLCMFDSSFLIELIHPSFSYFCCVWCVLCSRLDKHSQVFISLYTQELCRCTAVCVSDL